MDKIAGEEENELFLVGDEDIGDDFLEYDLFGSYVKDLSLVNELSDNEKKILIQEIIEVVSELNQLFVLVGCDQLKFDNGRYAWIVDKVLYCEKNCYDKVLVEKIKDLYDKFVFKRNILMN